MKNESILVGVMCFVFGCLVGVMIPQIFKSGQKPSGTGQYKSENRTQGQNADVPDPKLVKRQLEHVLKEYENLLKDDPKNSNALITVANVYFELNRYKEAIEAYKKTLEIKPENADARVDMAICYRRMGDFDTAIKEISKAIEYNPKHAMSHYNMAVILRYDKNDLEGAKKAWETYLEIEPNSSQKDFVKERLVEIQNILRNQPESAGK